MAPRPPRSPLFPYTTLFRSCALHGTLGPARTTMSAVAEHAGVRRSTLYRHFPDEAALFEACSAQDRKSTRLNSSHLGISYAVFCLKKKKNQHTRQRPHTHSA